MAYQALYRTWRPAQFADVVGQDHITRILSGQIELNKTSHAYLFAGPRGTGKTSLAKIFASAVNCMDRRSSEPCGKCEACQSGGVDTIEIDAASNNGVDNVREIRDRVNLLPAVCKYKVYIIDEAHMLSKGASNALLKTLEEPPPHVIFILATTEPHKLPPTIRSRCQRFDFRRIPADIILALLEKVATKEGLSYDKNALMMIARAAEGGMRDALSTLDQCIAYGRIDVRAVAGALGGTDPEKILKLTAYIAHYDEKNALEELRSIIDSGADTGALIKDLADFFRRMMWISCGAEADGFEELKEYAKAYGKRACVRALDILIAKEYEMRQNLRSDIVLETAVMAVMAPEDDKECGLSERIEKLEAKLKELKKSETVSADKETTVSASKKPAQDVNNESSKTAESKPKATGQQTDSLHCDYWHNLLESLKQEEYYIYTEAKRALKTIIKGSLLEITYDSEDEISAEFLKSETAKNALLCRIVKDAPEITQVSIILESKPKESNDLHVLEMFGSDIEQI